MFIRIWAAVCKLNLQHTQPTHRWGVTVDGEAEPRLPGRSEPGDAPPVPAGAVRGRVLPHARHHHGVRARPADPRRRVRLRAAAALARRPRRRLRAPRRRRAVPLGVRGLLVPARRRRVRVHRVRVRGHQPGRRAVRARVLQGAPPRGLLRLAAGADRRAGDVAASRELPL